jgi:hypothetical protein
MNRTGKTSVAGAAGLIAMLFAPASHARSGSVGGTELERRELGAVSPEASALVDGAERAVEDGHPKEAWSLFGRAWSLAPRSPLPSRGICRLALALGIQTAAQRNAAGEACTNALLLGGTPEDIRDKVASLIDGDPLPSMDDLVSASFAADGAARTGPGQPWGPAARGALALRLGDRELLEAAVAELRRIAPDHPETERLVALAAPRTTPWIWVWRLAVVLTFVLTVAHAVRRRLRPRRGAGGPVLVAATTLLMAIATATPAAAAAIDDAHPEKSVPSGAQQLADPLKFADLLSDLGARAEAATARGDHAAAARYYRALTQAVPTRAYAFAKLCEALEATGQRQSAIAACGTALTRQGTTAGNYSQFVRVLLDQEDQLSGQERQQAEAAIAALEKEPRATLIATRVRCNVAVHEHDVSALEVCTTKLAAAAPDAPSTLGFEWALAIEKNDRATAQRLAGRALASGLDQDVVARLQRASVGSRATRLARGLRWASEATLAFLLLALGTGAAVRHLERTRRRTVSP